MRAANTSEEEEDPHSYKASRIAVVFMYPFQYTLWCDRLWQIAAIQAALDLNF